MFVSLLSLTDKPLDEFKKTVSTRIEQTDSNIRLLGSNVNNLKGTVTELGFDLDAANERITIYADKIDNVSKTVTNLGVRLDAAEGDITIYADKIDNVSKTVTNLGVRLDTAEENITIYASKTTENASSISALTVEVDSISSTVVSVQGGLSEAKKLANAAQSSADAAAEDAADAYDEASSAYWKAYYAQLDADTANKQATANASTISQHADYISILNGRFDENGALVNASGLVTTSEFNSLYSAHYNLDGKVAAKAELSTSVQYDPATGLVTSAIKLTADKITLEGVTTINNSFRVDADGTTRIGGFTVEGGILCWKQYDYFANDSRSLKLGVSSTDTEGVVDVAFNAATSGRFGVKSVGSNAGGSAIYASTGSLTYPSYGMTYAGFFVGPVDVRDTNYGLTSDACASKQFRFITQRNSDGSYVYHSGVNWNKTDGSPDLDKIRLIVEGGIITGYYSE